MYTNSLKKFCTLTVIYAVLIVGIFVIQFKNDSIISEKIGNIHLTLLESVSEDNKVSLKNKMNLLYNGINFYVSDEQPATITVANSKRPISLIGWNKINNLSCELLFTNDVKLKISVSDDTPKAHFSIVSQLPSNVRELNIPYNISTGSSVLLETDSKIHLENKKNSWELMASKIEDEKVVFTQKENNVSLSYIDLTRSFSFANVASMEQGSETNYINYVEDFKNALISGFRQNLSLNQFTEQEVVSYVAAMAEKGRYVEAINSIPVEFRNSSSRTYLSAPYFNSLERMNNLLQRQMQQYEDMINHALDAGVLDVFNVNNLSDYMCMHPGSEKIRKLLTDTANSDLQGIPLIHATGILKVYSELYEKNKTLADLLNGAVAECINKIEKQCAIDGEVITMSENGQFLSVVRAVQIGSVLLNYAKVTSNSSLEGAARMIVNSYLKNASSFDVKTLADLYPIIVTNNKYYPHYEIMTFDNGKAVWAWTCANNIGYENDNNGTITLSIDFPVGYTHYLIINGIMDFESIYIYDLKFRTDHRFETYNSSGYVYKRDTETLLLKSRHKSEIENIRLVYLSEEVTNTDSLIETDVSN